METPIWWFLKTISLAAVLAQYSVEGQSSVSSSSLSPSPSSKASSRTTDSPSATITGALFQGFIIADTTTTPVSCPSGEVFATSGKYVACCTMTASSCAFATACKENAVVYKDSKTSDCGPLKCHMRQIFSAYGDKEPVFTEPLCAGAKEIDTLYQEVPMTSKLILPLIAADATTTAAAESSPVETRPPSPTAESSNMSSSNLSITILGAVFGGIGILALIIFAFWYGRKQGIEKRSKGKSVYEMKTLSATQTMENVSSIGLGTDPRLGLSNISGPSAVAGTLNR